MTLASAEGSRCGAADIFELNQRDCFPLQFPQSRAFPPDEIVAPATLALACTHILRRARVVAALLLSVWCHG